MELDTLGDRKTALFLIMSDTDTTFNFILAMLQSQLTLRDLSIMQAWPLARKIQVTQAKILEWYHHYGGKVAVSFSGGKDSTVLLDLARRAFPDIPAVFVDTGLEYPEIRNFVKSIPNVTWLRPEIPFPKVIDTYGYAGAGPADD